MDEIQEPDFLATRLMAYSIILASVFVNMSSVPGLTDFRRLRNLNQQ